MPNAQYLEILILAVVAAVILFRLYTVLGRRTGHEPPPEPFRLSSGEPQTSPKETSPKETLLPPQGGGADQLPPNDPVARGLLDIKLADGTFETDHFLAGAKSAYEMIVTAFARADRATLKPLLSPEVFAAFEQVIGAREAKSEHVEFTFVGFKDVKIVHAALKNRAAEVTVAIGAQFISATLDGAGQLVEGDTKSVRDVTDVWTFCRDTKARDPNWLLVATSGHEA